MAVPWLSPGSHLLYPGSPLALPGSPLALVLSTLLLSHITLLMTDTPTITQVSRPFFSHDEIEYLYSLTIPENLTLAYLQKKHQCFAFAFHIVRSLKFPLRVLSTAMNYFHRYYLFNRFVDPARLPPEDAGLVETDPLLVTVTCLFLASKNEDCIKKLRDVQITASKAAGWDLRPDYSLAIILVTSSSTTSSTSSASNTTNTPVPFLERQRRTIMSLEFKLLQNLKFDFLNGCSVLNVASLDILVVQFAKQLHIPYRLTLFAWVMAFDLLATPLPLIVPPHCIAVAILVVALNLKPNDIATKRAPDPRNDGHSLEQILNSLDCHAMFRAPEPLVNEAIIHILDYYIHEMQKSVLTDFIPNVDSDLGKEQVFKFMDLKLRFNDLARASQSVAALTLHNDHYLKLWDYLLASKGCARFMLSSRRQRFNKELHARNC